MNTLFINAPAYQAVINSKRSFSQTIKSGVGNDYALNSKILRIAKKLRNVILLDKSKKRKATGLIVKIVATGAMAGNGIPRYDIHMTSLQECHYKPESLNRNGVTII